VGVLILPPPHRGGFFYLLACFIMTDFVIITADKHTNEKHHICRKLSVWKSLLLERENRDAQAERVYVNRAFGEP